MALRWNQPRTSMPSATAAVHHLDALAQHVGPQLVVGGADALPGHDDRPARQLVGDSAQRDGQPLGPGRPAGLGHALVGRVGPELASAVDGHGAVVGDARRGRRSPPGRPPPPRPARGRAGCRHAGRTPTSPTARRRPGGPGAGPAPWRPRRARCRPGGRWPRAALRRAGCATHRARPGGRPAVLRRTTCGSRRPGGVTPRQVAVEGPGHRLEQREPAGHAVADDVGHQLDPARPPDPGPVVGEAALVEEPARQGPLVEAGPHRHAVGPAAASSTRPRCSTAAASGRPAAGTRRAQSTVRRTACSPWPASSASVLGVAGGEPVAVAGRREAPGVPPRTASPRRAPCPAAAPLTTAPQAKPAGRCAHTANGVRVQSSPVSK